MNGVSSGESIKKSVTRARKRANMSSSHSSARSKKSIKLKNKREGGNSTIIEASQMQHEQSSVDGDQIPKSLRNNRFAEDENKYDPKSDSQDEDEQQNILVENSPRNLGRPKRFRGPQINLSQIKTDRAYQS